MTIERIAGRRAGALQLLVAIAVTSALAALAYIAMFTGFNGYDDEGYFLVTLRDFVGGHPMFTQALPIYGPFYYEVVGGLFRVLGVTPTNDSGRLVTAGIWVLGSAAAGLTVYAMTRGFLLGLVAELLTFRVLNTLTGEPTHPSGLISVILVLLVLAACFMARRPRAAAAAMGAGVAALVLIKINVGAFALLALGFSWAATLPDRWRRYLLPGYGVLLAVSPFVLTRPLAHFQWVTEFALLVSLSLAAITIATLATADGRLPRPGLRWIAAGGVALAAITLAIAVIEGTRIGDIWNGLVVLAIRFPGTFVYAVNVHIRYDVWAAVATLAALGTLPRFAPFRVPPLVAGALRIAIAAGTWASFWLLPSDPYFLVALPVAWVAVVSPQTDQAQTGIPPIVRVFLPAYAVLESLQLYPVAGTQLSMAALLLVPLGAVIFADGVRQVSAVRLGSLGLARPAGAAAPAVLAITAIAMLVFASSAVQAYQRDVPLGLPGAESVRVPAPTAQDLRALVADMRGRCSTFITYPGMGSFYVWTDQYPSQRLASEVWWMVLGDAEQGSIVARIQGDPRFCVVKNQAEIDFWAQGRPVPPRALTNFIDQDFVVEGRYGDYQLLVRAERPAT